MKTKTGSDKTAKTVKEFKEFVAVNVGHVDWKLLRKQKCELLTCIAALQNDEKTIRATYLEGILNLIDHIQDTAAIQVGEKTVFGKDA